MNLAGKRSPPPALTWVLGYESGEVVSDIVLSSSFICLSACANLHHRGNYCSPFPLETFSAAHALDFWVPTEQLRSKSSSCLLSHLFPVTRGMSRRWGVPRQAGRTRGPSAACWQLPVPLPWLSSWVGLMGSPSELHLHQSLQASRGSG